MNLTELLTTLEAPIVVRPTRRMTQGELESYLDKAADILRGNADHSEFRGYVFALLFYKRINDCYEEEVRTQADTLIKAGVEQEQALQLARDPQNHHFIVPEAADWAKVARTAKGQLGQALNDAMLAIERANAHRQNNFDGILTGKIDFNKQDELPRDKLVNLINHFGSQTFDRAHVSDDLFGNAYEYLIRNFASKAGKSSGEFYTPAEVGFLMSEMLEPKAGHEHLRLGQRLRRPAAPVYPLCEEARRRRAPALPARPGVQRRHLQHLAHQHDPAWRAGVGTQTGRLACATRVTSPAPTASRRSTASS